MQKKIIVISASSDIGAALCTDWIEKEWDVFGTFRTSTTQTDILHKQGVQLISLDLLNKSSIESCCNVLLKDCHLWDALIFAPGSLDPVGDFEKIDFDEWEKGIEVNLTSQLRVLHKLLSSRNKGATVLFFAGGGSNGAPKGYSSYVVSKIALTKMCEVLDAEIPDTRFVIVGPGWVKTKIHEPTLNAGPLIAGDNYEKTLAKLNSEECTPMQDVVDCCTWLITTPGKAVNGRNFSVVFDKWKNPELEEALSNNHDMYKLRRHGNSWTT